MKKIFTLTIILALVLAGCGDGATPDNGNGGNNENNTTLKIKNESFIGITEVIWNNFTFASSKDIIIPGTNREKDVTIGSGYIYFKREGNSIPVRTDELIVINNNDKNEFVLTNNTIIKEVSNSDNTATLYTFFSKSWIIVKQDNKEINPYGEYNFGNILPNENKNITFSIENIGLANLTLENINSNRVNLEENTSGKFNVSRQPLASSVTSGNATSFTISFSPTESGTNYSANVNIKTNSQNIEEFIFRVKGSCYKIGDRGPGSGIIFFAQGGQFKECSGDLGSYNWETAMNTARNYQGGSLTDWYLPDRGELELIYQNLYLGSLDEFSVTTYWCSTAEPYNNYKYHLNILTGVFNAFEASWNQIRGVRAVRAF